MENQAYVLACGTAGTHAGVRRPVTAIVVDPWGEVLAEAGPDEEVLTVEFDPAKVATTREQFPALKDRLLGLEAPRRLSCCARGRAPSAVSVPAAALRQPPSPRPTASSSAPAVLPVSRPPVSFSARWITHTATAISSAGSASSRTTSTP